MQEEYTYFQSQAEQHNIPPHMIGGWIKSGGIEGQWREQNNAN